MANMSDYLKWRGDVPFTVDEFNDVDNLILAFLAYTVFDDIVPEDGEGISLEEARDLYFMRHDREDVMRETNPIFRAPLLMDDMLTGNRFGSTVLSNYVSIVDQEKGAQFSALTYKLADGTAYIAYRGTDTSLLGWREDFNMSYLSATEGQRLAAAYLDQMNRRIKTPVRVGGHSKGGNFAMYAAAFARSDIRDRIIRVYNNDGPGFRQEVKDSPKFELILPKLTSIVPDTSIIGMLLSIGAAHSVVKSSEKGIMQHDGFSWQVARNEFVAAELSSVGRFIRQTQQNWLDGIDDERRARFVDQLFSLLEATGAETFDEMVGQKVASLEKILSAMGEMPPEDKKEFLRIFGELMSSGKGTVLSRASEFFTKNKKEEK